MESTIEPNMTNNTKYSLVSITPSKTDPHKGIFLVARNDPSYVHSLQSHITFSKDDKISFIANYKKNDMN